MIAAFGVVFKRGFQLSLEDLLKKLAFNLFLYGNRAVDLMETEDIASFSKRSPLLSCERDRIVSEGSVILSSLVLVLR